MSSKLRLRVIIKSSHSVCIGRFPFKARVFMCTSSFVRFSIEIYYISTIFGFVFHLFCSVHCIAKCTRNSKNENEQHRHTSKLPSIFIKMYHTICTTKTRPNFIEWHSQSCIFIVDVGATASRCSQ